MNPSLDNFDGVVAVRLCDVKGHDLPVTEGEGSGDPCATPGQECRAEVRFEREAARSNQGFQTRLVIKDGNDSDTVTFDVSLDGEMNSFIPRDAQCTFQPARETPTLTFGFTAPEQAGRHVIFVEVTQKLRLVQVVMSAVRVVAL